MAADLEISDLRVSALRERISQRIYVVVRVQTKAGLVGWGECGRVSTRELDVARQAIIGQPASAYDVLHGRLAEAGSLRAGINVALLDVLGKAAKAPVYQLLGGPTRNKVRALAAAPPEAAREAGYRAFMVPAPPVSARNQGQAFVQAVVRRIEQLRASLGDEMDFVLDGGGRLSPGDAASLSAALERAHLLWFDEPCPLANLGSVRKLAGERVTPLGFGRHARNGGEFQDLLREEAVDVLRPDLASHGISAIRKIAALAETYYVAVAPFHDGGPIGTAAALHLAASLPNFFIQQIPAPEAAEDRRMRAELVAQPVEAVRDGFAALPAGPGLGIAVNEKALEKYRAASY